MSAMPPARASGLVIASLFGMVSCAAPTPQQAERAESPTPSAPARPAAEPAAEVENRVADLEARIGFLDARVAELEQALAGYEKPVLASEPAALVEALGDGDIVRRYRAGRELIDIGSAAVAPLLAAIEEKPGSRKAETATLVLSEMRDPASVDAQLAAYRSGLGTTGRAAILLAMGRRQEARGIPIVLAGLGDEKTEVRLAAMKSAERLGLVEAVPLLVKLGLGGSAEEQRLATHALRRLGPASLADIRAAMETASTADRVRALQLVEAIGGPEALVIAREFLGDETPQVRLAAAHVLAFHGSPEGRVVAEVIAGQRSDERLRKAAEEILRMPITPAVAPATSSPAPP